MPNLEGHRNHCSVFLDMGQQYPIKHLEVVRGGLALLGLVGNMLPPIGKDAAGVLEVVGSRG